MLDPLHVVVGLAASELSTPLTLRHDHSWPHREATVAEVLDAGGTPWIVKQVRVPEAFTREVRALREWAPRLGEGMAPRLIATVPGSSVMVMDKLPGRAGSASTAAEFHQASRLLRPLHEAEPATADAGYPARAADSVDRWIQRVPGVVDAADLDFVRAQIRLLETMPDVRSGPIHNDYQPRNWLTDAGATVRVIDFGKSKRDVQLRDFERMWYQEWRHRPDLREAFFDGYGRTLSDGEERALACIGAVGALTTVLWARSHGAESFERHGRRMLELLRGRGPAR
ncbi:phosphotransferase [Actinoplanes sp. NEAU-A12]|uniref:Phosphotransferase n=1 Tax=Actinoplanes sandaracinus TaxID=3045177 RepID=A0ABT6WGM3_9ACTN|nr:phosphotransferase [Actinoplanes sandaracinus]MDI6098874.1 phosphotransferase [Actinoplanes sandaracinus]